MYHSLHAFLANIWDAQTDLLYGGPTKEEATLTAPPTLEDRIYGRYASGDTGANATTSPTAYTRLLQPLAGVAARAGFTADHSQRGFFMRFNGKGTGSDRLYVNPKLARAAAVMRYILEVAEGQHKPLPGQRPLPRTEHIGLAKIAEAKEAFCGRPDKIVVYLATSSWAISLGQAIARQFAADLEAEIPRMTRPLAPGVACAKEISIDQFSVGTSFGEVRCALIAQALFGTVTGKTYGDLPSQIVEVENGTTQTRRHLRVPLVSPTPQSGVGGWRRGKDGHWIEDARTASSTFVDFCKAVEQNLDRHGIKALEIWH